MGVLTPADVQSIDAEAKAIVDEAERFAKESPYPTREELMTGM